MLDMRKLVLLREVEARGSIAAAARALSYTRSAVSQQLSALEAEMGTALLDRGSRQAGLTAAGRLLAAHAERILGQLEAAEAEVHAQDGRVAGLLRVGVPLHDGPALLVPALTRLRALHPGLRITLHGAPAAESREMVRLGQLDAVLAARYDQVPEPPVASLHEEPVAADPVRLATAPDHPLAGHATVRLAEFADAPWLIDPASGLGRLALHACAGAGFAPDVVSDIGDLQAVLALVSLGWGVALVPDLAPGRPGYPVARISVRDGDLTRRTMLVVRKGAVASPPVAALLTVVREASAELARDKQIHRADRSGNAT